MPAALRRFRGPTLAVAFPLLAFLAATVPAVGALSAGPDGAAVSNGAVSNGAVVPEVGGAVATEAPGAPELLIQVDEAVLVDEPGTIANLATVPIPADRQGSACVLAVHSENQVSIHPGNDLLVTTGDQVSVIADVEARPDQVRDLSVDVVLGPNVAVDLRMGPTRVSSLGFDITLDCPPPVVVAPVEDTNVPPPPPLNPIPPDVCTTPVVTAGSDSAAGAGTGGAEARQPSVSVAADGCGDMVDPPPATSPDPAGADGQGGEDADEELQRPLLEPRSGTDSGTGSDQVPPLPQAAPAAPVVAAPAYTG